MQSHEGRSFRLERWLMRVAVYYQRFLVVETVTDGAGGDVQEHIAMMQGKTHETANAP